MASEITKAVTSIFEAQPNQEYYVISRKIVETTIELTVRLLINDGTPKSIAHCVEMWNTKRGGWCQINPKTSKTNLVFYSEWIPDAIRTTAGNIPVSGQAFFIKIGDSLHRMNAGACESVTKENYVPLLNAFRTAKLRLAAPALPPRPASAAAARPVGVPRPPSTPVPAHLVVARPVAGAPTPPAHLVVGAPPLGAATPVVATPAKV